MDDSLSLYSVSQVREFDRRAIDDHGIAGVELMNRAGRAVVRVLRARFPRARRVAIVCGPGNNGGDGYVVARLLKEAGLQPVVFALGDSGKSSVEAARMRVEAEAAGIFAQPFTLPRLKDADVIVDGLLGIGLQRPVRGEWRAVIEEINNVRLPVIAVDIPSGLNADTGAVMGAAIRADITVSFIGLKSGLFTSAGREQSGEILLDDLDVPGQVYRDVTPVALRLDERSLTGKWPRRRRDAHKGNFGHVLVVGGGPGMAGAAMLCGEAAYRTGAGLVTLATHSDRSVSARAEVLVYSTRTAANIKSLIKNADVIALGPGLSQTPWAKIMFRSVMTCELPLVLDADALNLLAGKKLNRKDWILTPHPGEAARLLGVSVADVQSDRFSAARAIVKRHGGVCVLKGSGTVVAGSGNEPFMLCDRGNPGMAKGGAGDVLTGVIASLRAQGLSAFDAACAGVWLHATAGDRAAQVLGEASLLAGDLSSHLAAQLDKLRA